MKEELTTKMHEELTITKDDDGKLRAGCVWHIWCDRNSSRKEIEKYAKMYSISYETAIKFRDYWLRKYQK